MQKKEKTKHQNKLNIGKMIQTAKEQGFTGLQYSFCESYQVRKNGTCDLCLNCGQTTGCS